MRIGVPSCASLLLVVHFAASPCKLASGGQGGDAAELLGLGEPEVQGRWPGMGKVFDLATTPQGLIWLATDTGLSRFDRRRFKHHSGEDHLALHGTRPKALLTDREGSLWVGLTSGRLLRLRVPGRFEEMGSLGTEEITAIAQDWQGQIWVAAGKRIARWQPSQGLVPVAFEASHPITQLAGDPQGRLWVGTEGGLQRLAENGLKKASESAPVSALRVGSDGSLWIGMARKLARIDLSVEHPAPQDVRGWVAQALTIGTDQRLWVGRQMAGLSTLAPDGSSTNLGADLTDLGIDALTTDANGGIWGATSSGTLFVVRPRGLAAWGSEAGIKAVPSFAVTHEANGDIWFSSLAGLYRLASGGLSHLSLATDRLPTRCNRSLAVSDAGTLWLATCDEGLLQWRGEGFAGPVEEPQKLSHLRNVWARRQGGVWASDAFGNLHVLTSGELSPPREGLSHCLRASRVRDGACPHEILSLLEEHDGNLLLGTRGQGLLRLDTAGKVSVVELGLGPSPPSIQALWRTGDAIWIGTDGQGLIRWARKQAQPVPEAATGLPRSIYGLTEDALGRLWLSSDAGVYRIPRADLDDVLANRRARAVARRFGQEDGMPSIRCARDFSPAIDFVPPGVVLVPTVAGLTAFDARRPETTSGFPKITVEEVWVDGSRIETDLGANEVAWRRGHGNLAVSVLAPSLLSPGGIDLRARLVGQEPWQAAGPDGVFRFPDLSSGRHVVEARVDRAATGESVVLPLMHIRLLSLHELAWFRMLLAGAVITMGALLLWLRQRQARVRIQAVLEERKRLAQDLHDALAVSFTGIGYQLDALAQVVGKEAPPGVRKILEDTRAMVHHSRQEARRSVWDIRSQTLESRSLPDALRGLADEASKVAQARIVVDAGELDHEPPAETCETVVRIAQEALVNALAHGHAQNITLKVDANDGELVLRVEDDGRGLDMNQVEGGMHFGLLGMQERAEAQGGRFGIERREEGGTRLSVRFPLRRLPWSWRAPWKNWQPARRRR